MGQVVGPALFLYIIYFVFKRLVLLIISFYVFSSDDIEEVVTTGSLLTSTTGNAVEKEIIKAQQIKDFGLVSFAELSQYITSSSGSRFQSNTLGGQDQGMASINLRGLEQESTLVLINSKRQTFAGTPSDDGGSYIDIGIIPEVALREVQILKEGASTTYGSDAVSGVVNVLTFKEFNGLKVNFGRRQTANYDQNDNTFGFLYGANFKDLKFVFGYNNLQRSPLPVIDFRKLAELAVSGLGNSFVLTEADTVEEGPYAGEYEEGALVPDPNCVENGGILSGRCRFQYGTRFNLVNNESHEKFYLNLNSFQHSLLLIASNVKVIDNPQSPSYPALPFLSREIMPGVGGSPFNVPVRWLGRPLGGRYPSPFSPKDISQHHFSYAYELIYRDFEIEFSVTDSQHENLHRRPDIIDSRFLSALNGSGGASNNEQWDIFNPANNSASLISYIKGFERSNKTGGLTVFDLIARTFQKDLNLNLAFGIQQSRDRLKIRFNELSRVEFDSDGKLTKTADLFFLGGGQNVERSRNKSSLFFEGSRDFTKSFTLVFSGRYEDADKFSSFNPKLSVNFKPFENLSLRIAKGESFKMPSMGQLFSSQIRLGSVRDVEGSVFVRQAQLGNPELKPSVSQNTNFGIYYQDNQIKVSLDLWEIDYTNRIEVESAQALIESDPYGSSITRNNLGDLIGVTTRYFNESSTLVSGIDFNYFQEFNFFDSSTFTIDLKGTKLDEFLTPESFDSTVMINRVGRFNFDNNTFSLPKFRINNQLVWSKNDSRAGVITRFIDSYENLRSIPNSAQALGYTNKVDAFLVHDLFLEYPLDNFFRAFKTNTDFSLQTTFSIINIFDEGPPLLYDAPDFSYDTRVHDPRGRMISIQFSLLRN